MLTFLENPDANCILNSPLVILLPYGGSCAITDFLRDVYADLILSTLLTRIVFFRYKWTCPSSEDLLVFHVFWFIQQWTLITLDLSKIILSAFLSH